MNAMKEIWNGFISVLKTYDIGKVMQLLAKLEWSQVVTNPWVWCVGILIVGFSVWKRRIGLVVLAGSCILFLVLVQHTVPKDNQAIALSSLLEFIGGATFLLVLNLYFLIIRDK